MKVAFRNLFRQKKRTVFTGLSMFVGYVLACISIGWADGTYNSIIDNFTGNELGHIQIHRNGYLDKPDIYTSIEETGRIDEVLDEIEDVDSHTARIYSYGLLSSGDKSTGVRIIGVEPKTENETTNMVRKVKDGRYFGENPKDVLLGTTLAGILETKPLDSVVIVSQAADGSIANDRYEVAGIIDTGDPAADRSSIYLTLGAAQDLFVLGGGVHEIVITVSSLGRVDDTVKTIKARLNDPDLEVVPWQVFAQEFYRAMQADKGGMYIMLMVIILVVAITVLNTILMAVLERQKEYGVLRALGTRPMQIVRMVISETLLLSLASILMGAVIGFVVNALLSQHGIPLSRPLEWGGMYIESMKSELTIQSFFLPAITVIGTAFIVSVFPAIKAARTEPAITMRTI